MNSDLTEKLEKAKVEAERCLLRSPRESLQVSLNYFQLAEEQQSPNDLALATRYVGYTYRNLGDLERSLRFYFKALRYARKYGLDQVTQSLFNDIGVIYRNKGNYHKALEYYFQALEGASLNTIASAYNNIAVIYRVQKEDQKALQFYQKAHEIFVSIGEDQERNIGVTKANIADIFVRLGHLQKAKENYIDVLRFGEGQGISQIVLQSLTGLGKVFKLEGDYEKALECLSKSLIVCDAQSFNRKKLPILLDLGDLYFLINEHQQAETYYLEALALGESMSKEKEITCLEKTTKFYEQQEEFKKAFSFFKRWSDLKDQKSQEERDLEMSRLQLKFETHEKEKEIQNLKKENELKTLLLEKGEQLKRKNQELKEFSYAISHDLKEPVRMISSFSKLLDSRMEGKLSSDERELFSFLNDGANRLSKMIDDLYRYATVGTEETDLESTSLDLVVNDVKKNLAILIEDNDATVLCNTNLDFTTYKVLFEQLLQNLISNAIKFRREGVPPVVEINGERRADELIFTVKDNGIGIEREYQDQIFKLFKRAKTVKDKEGSGIGLALCQKITAKLGGEIQLESSLGKGSTFLIRIKRADLQKDPL